MEPVGYPSYFLLLVLFLGFGLAVVRPYWAFLMSVILFCVLSPYLATFTRTSAFGPYLNLYDACFLVALVALAFDRTKKKYILPSPVILIFLVLAIGILTTVISFRMNYLVLRTIRWGLTFPLAFLIAANIVANGSRAKSFLYAIIIGSVLGSLYSFFEYKSHYIIEQGEEAVRLSIAQRGLSVSLLIAATQQSFFKYRRLLVRLLWVVALILFASCILFAQWRATFLAIIMSLIILPFVLGKPENLIRSTTLIGIVLCLTLVTLGFIFPKIQPERFFERYSFSPKGYSFQKAENIGRYIAIEKELGHWYEGNWLTGRGLGYNAFMKRGLDSSIAWGHVGYVSYLSNLGLLGLFVYGILLPLKVFIASRQLYSGSDEWAITTLGLLGVVTVIIQTIVSFMSSSYLSATMHTIGFLYGAVWALRYGKMPNPMDNQQ